MTPLTGWIKFHRKTIDSAVWNLSNAQLRVWLTCLLMANNTSRNWFDGTGEVEIPRGSFITSQPKLAEKARVSRKAVRGALKVLERIGSIRAKTRAKRYTEITVVNFDTYQASEQMRAKRGAKQGPSKGHNVRMKEREKERKEPSSSFAEQTFWEKFSPQNQEVIRQTIEAIHSTRKKGQAADSIIQTEFHWWDQQDPAQVIRGMHTYLEKRYADEGKREKYLRGIIRNSDGQAPLSQTSPEVRLRGGHPAIRRAALSMTEEDVSD